MSTDPHDRLGTICQCGHEAVAEMDYVDGGYRRLSFWACGNCGSRWGWRLYVNQVHVASGDEAYDLIGGPRYRRGGGPARP